MATRTNNTMQEVLAKLVQDIASAFEVPDADTEWLADMQARIVAKQREPINRMTQAGMTQATPPMADPSMGDPSMAPGPMPGMAPPAMGGVGPGRNPMGDEVRRMISGTAEPQQ